MLARPARKECDEMNFDSVSRWRPRNRLMYWLNERPVSGLPLASLKAGFSCSEIEVLLYFKKAVTGQMLFEDS